MTYYEVLQLLYPDSHETMRLNYCPWTMRRMLTSLPETYTLYWFVSDTQCVPGGCEACWNRPVPEIHRIQSNLYNLKKLGGLRKPFSTLGRQEVTI